MADEALPLSIIKKFIVLTDYYNSKERVMEEINFWYEDTKSAFINEIDKSYVQILNLRRGKNKKKTTSNEINANYASKLLALKQTIISLHYNLDHIDASNTKTKQIAFCIMYAVTSKDYRHGSIFNSLCLDILRTKGRLLKLAST